ncbi:FAD-binding protein [Methylacidiphilum caldifontis]|uniref:FAD-linked oxidase C-terminal domain-containing protein n=1 Tax=Methylacidiphilum caldifontis TaxID=2795386 RepID=UPI001A8DBC5F|nr:FAD-linked oxidase C-terminal domain-containing protein [Methylacidiphilum caldifontis]QSR89107.1 FAD-binding protein [Methylacidiphilum caldifontis]
MDKQNKRIRKREEFSPFLQSLLSILPAGNVIYDPERLTAYECDGLTAFRATPLAVLLPRSVEEILSILAVCKRYKVPIVPRGAGTGLSGGATPIEGAVVLSLARFNRVLEIDPKNRTARVEPGVTNIRVSQEAAPYGLYFSPDPSSQIACTIGGNIAENAGGIHCLKYGLTVNNVLGLKLITLEGDILTLGGKGAESPGYDLLPLIVGSEGLLGIIVEATLRLLPKPECAQLVVGCFDDLAKASQAVSLILSFGIIPSGLEMMDKLVLDAVQADMPRALLNSAQAILFCEVDGMQEEVEEQSIRVKEIMLKAGAKEIVVSKDDSERMLLWKCRKSAFPAMGRISPDYYCMDGTIPRKKLAYLLKKIDELSAHYNLKVGNVFHAGDGNLHPLILYDQSVPGEFEKVEKMGEKILELCVQVGGVITGEHGVGLEKLNSMCIQFSSEEIEQFRRVKKAFDPYSLLNPAKTIPTLHRCAEFGKMHLHKDNDLWGGLERF